jgi:YHS domain-containing protein
MLDAVSICIQYDVGGTYYFCTDDLRHRQDNGHHENYFSNRLQRSSHQKQHGAPLGDHTFRI